ncbi:flagellar hook-associated protein FlgK [Thiomicrorhabdus sp.]|uniref:flagellar hook-associated protein FlgK n=1 Tax=Thiomicrorhabdus sp. TaxID=2039724 RepID=UPI0029C6D186|nr:flagellar hook-associated protein FlgK [Thiomicrorhabdus sp.]
MADMLTIGTVATNTFKKALDVTSHNVANVTTEGYSRQRAEISSNTPNVVGSAFLGGGSTVDSITRIHADYIQSQLNTSQSLVSRYDTQSQLAQQVEGVISSNDEGVQTFIQQFFEAVQTVANNPTSTSARQVMLDESTNLESHIGNLSTILQDTHNQVNSYIGDLIGEVNSRLESIQAINQQVQRAEAVGQQTPNDLLDQRDQAILELSQYIDIQVYKQEDGSVDIHTGNGRLPLLSDNSLSRLEVGSSAYGDENRQEVYMTLNGQRQSVSDRISGGELGGVLDFRSNMLDQAENDLGLMLNGLAAATNWQHYQGYDANGDAGGNYFTPLSMSALDNAANQGTASGSQISVSFNPNAGVSEPPYDGVGINGQPATYGDKQTYFENALDQISQLEAKEYELRYNSATDSFDFFDYKTSAPIVDSSGNPVSVARGSSANVDGFNFDFTSVTAAPAENDRFLVQPHKQMLSDFALEIDDPDLIAARGQSPVDSNSDGSLDDEVPAAAGDGDNVNIANLAGLQSRNLLLADNNGQASETLLGAYSLMTTNVGTYVRSSDIQLSAQNSVYSQLSEQRESISGVNLDEEAANLLRFQQAYEAAAQIISTSQSLFQTLLGVVRG